MKTEKRYRVFNRTDGILADPRQMTLDEAKTFIRSFPRRFARQGYYLTATRERIQPEEVELEILDKHWKPVLIEHAPGYAEP